MHCAPSDVPVTTVLVDAITYEQQRNNLTGSVAKAPDGHIRAMFVPEKEIIDLLESSHD